MDGLQRAFEARTLAIEPVDHDEAGKAELLGGLPGFLGLHLHAGHGIDDDERRIGHAQPGACVGEKVRHSGRIDDVDLGFVPLGVGQARGERMFAGYFFLVEVSHRVAFVNFAETIDRARVEENGRA